MDYINRLRRYEAEKRKISAMGLNPAAYESAIKELIKKYKI